MLTGKKHTAEDSRLLMEMSAGSNDAFEILYSKYWDDVFDEAYKRLKDIDEAKDIVQEVFTYLWTKAAVLDIKNLPAWFTTVVRNKIFSSFRKQEKFVPMNDMMTELESFGEDTDASLIRKELAKTYEALISSLPEQQRTIFNMRYREDLVPDQIALKLNLSPKTVRNHLGRALLKLKTAFLFVCLLLLITIIGK